MNSHGGKQNGKRDEWDEKFHLGQTGTVSIGGHTSGSTDLARRLAGHVASAICGHTEQIAKEHYWQVAGSDLDEAIRIIAPKSVPIFVPNDCQSESSQDDKSSDSVPLKHPKPLKNSQKTLILTTLVMFN